jgi:hypothetical protein
MTDKTAQKEYLRFIDENQKKLFHFHSTKIEDIVLDYERNSDWGHDYFDYNGKKYSVFCRKKEPYIPKTTVICACGQDFTGIVGRHVLSCEDLAEKIATFNPRMLNTFLRYNKSRKNGLSKEMIKRFGDKTHKNNVVSITKHKEVSSFETLLGDYQNILQSCANVELFPKASGVYFIVMENNEKDVVLYVGRSINMHERWKNHHRFEEISFLESVGIKIKYMYIAENPVMKFRKSLEEIENHFIELLKPKLNYKQTTNFSLNKHCDVI